MKLTWRQLRQCVTPSSGETAGHRSEHFQAAPMENSPVIYQKPQLLTTFSLDHNGQFNSPNLSSGYSNEPDLTGCRILFPINTSFFENPKEQLNLKNGFHYLASSSSILRTVTHAPKLVDQAENLDNLLKALELQARAVGRNLALPQVITWRGILTKLLTAAYLKDSFALKLLWFNVRNDVIKFHIIHIDQYFKHRNACILWKINLP